MKQIPVSFGRSDHLEGIFIDGSRNKPVVITWNTGIHHRVGPTRLYVELANTLYNDHDLACLRFDLSMLGESQNADDSLEGQERNIRDVQDAMNFLQEEYGFSSFILVGLCSSAIDAFQTAVIDERVKSLVMVDTFAFKTMQYYQHYYANRVFSGKRWKKLIEKTFSSEESDSNIPKDEFEGFWPSQEEANRGLEALQKRGVNLFVTYTGGYEYIYTYDDQFRDMFPNIRFGDKLSLSRYPEADHLFLIREDRIAFFTELSAWLQFTIPQELNKARTLVDLIDSWPERFGRDTAIQHSHDRYSYFDIDKRSKIIAASLQEQGVCPGDRVLVSLERGVDLIATIIAILRAGAAYVPIDLSYPEDRKQYMATTSHAKIAVCESSNQAFFEALEIKCLSPEKCLLSPDMFRRVTLTEDATAYIIFTSGSTGKPKGVEMPHASLLNLIQWQKKSLPSLGACLQFTPISFDVSFQEIFGSLETGSKLCLISNRDRMDPSTLLDHLLTYKINSLFLPYVALQILADEATRSKVYPSSLQNVVSAGEQLKITSSIRLFFQHLPSARLHNHYGPSESHVVTSYILHSSPKDWPDLPPIGQAIDGCLAKILPNGHDKSMGELLLGGVCLAKGYFRQEEQTNQKFRLIEGERYYHTGDLVEIDSEGQFLYLGRNDSQVKIRGYRVELAEVELAISKNSECKEAIVFVDRRHAEDPCLQALVQCEQGLVFDAKSILQNLSESLPEYMVPEGIYQIENIIHTPSGKIDRKSLIENWLSSAEDHTPVQNSDNNNQLEQESILKIFRKHSRNQSFSWEDSFFDHGGNSIRAIALINELNNTLKTQFKVTKLFDSPSPKKLFSIDTEIKKSEDPVLHSNEPIAIVGMSCRVPGASHIEELWEILQSGSETAHRFDLKDLDPSIPDTIKTSPNYVPVRGTIDKADCFDHKHFGISLGEARILDPQQRHLLELAVQAIEDAGIDLSKNNQVGVYTGVGHNTYYLKNLFKNEKIISQVGEFAAMLANDKDYTSTRIAHKLNLSGPAISVHTACSTSLVATIMGVRALQNGECKAALCGGFSLSSPVASGHLYNEGGILTKDGHCRPFDDDATGTYFSDGGGLVVLKRLSDARKDQDRIYGIIQGCGLNNDGGDKASFSSPSIEGQKRAIQSALQEASLKHAAPLISVECHGTATPIGDPIEVEALEQAIKDYPHLLNPKVGIGSIKGNFGHLTSAAGVIGLIKSALSCYHQKLVPTINFKKLNRKIDLSSSPLCIQSHNELPDLPQNFSIGVSSFGVGGTNAHLVLSNDLDEVRASSSKPMEGYYILPLSAASEHALRDWTQLVSTHISTFPEQVDSIENLLWKTARGQNRFRNTIVANYTGQGLDFSLSETYQNDRQTKRVIWCFPGQGSQFLGMACAIYHAHPMIKERIDQGHEFVRQKLGIEILPLLLTTEHREDLSHKLNQTLYTQPALFIVQYALGEFLQSLRVDCDAMIGHSVGEFAAAALDQCFSFEDGLDMICDRAKVISAVPEGSMAQTNMTLSQLHECLPQDISIAAINGPKSIVIAGSHHAIDTFIQSKQSSSVLFRRLKTSHAFHSAMMESASDDFHKILANRSLAKGHGRVFPTSLSDHHDLSKSDYWSKHISQAVNFYPRMNQLIEQLGNVTLIEVGPGRVLGQLAMKFARKSIAHHYGLVGKDTQKASTSLWMTIGSLAAQLQNLDLSIFKSDINHSRTFFMPPRIYSEIACWHHIPAISDKQKAINHNKDHHQNIEQPVSKEEKIMTQVHNEIVKIVEDTAGLPAEDIKHDEDFYELGLDSLFLTQFAINLQQHFNIDITFRQLSVDLLSINDVAAYILDKKPELNAPKQEPEPSSSNKSQTPVQAPPTEAAPAAQIQLSQPISLQTEQLSAIQSNPGSASGIIAAQLQLMEQQLKFLQGQQIVQTAPSPVINSVSHSQDTKKQVSTTVTNEKTTANKEKKGDNFGAQVKIYKEKFLDDKGGKAINEAEAVINKDTQKSKLYTQKYRKQLADPRAVTQFTQETKEYVYPIVAKKSHGPHIWDLDDRVYIDLLNGFGSNFLGYNADIIVKAIQDQLSKGFAVGPQHELAGPCAELVCELTGHDRAAFCNTGSEAVLGAMRIARLSRGRDKILIFKGAYHGIFDEVIVKALPNGKSVPASAGVHRAAVENVVLFDYPSEEALEYIRNHGNELAAVMVEPVQSRRPAHQPFDFLRQLRTVTQETGVILIFDEVITGFRLAADGCMGYINVKADITTYGKIPGGGMPIGIIGGRSDLMNALDGGPWQYGDHSFPEFGVTYFAGTFVRHPLTLAAVQASLGYMKQQPHIFEMLNKRGEWFRDQLNQLFRSYSTNFEAQCCGSLLGIINTVDPQARLLSYWLRCHHVHQIWGYPMFLTLAHTEEVLQQALASFDRSLKDLIQRGLVEGSAGQSQSIGDDHIYVPEFGWVKKSDLGELRIGKTPEGELGLFKISESNPDRIVQVKKKP